MEKMIFVEALAAFGAPLMIYPATEGEYVNTEWLSKYSSEPLSVTEPFVPSVLAEEAPKRFHYQESFRYQEGGRIEEYDMTWFSTHDVPLKSKVVHNGFTYVVEKKTSYLDYSDVVEYKCKGVANFGD